MIEILDHQYMKGIEKGRYQTALIDFFVVNSEGTEFILRVLFKIQNQSVSIVEPERITGEYAFEAVSGFVQVVGPWAYHIPTKVYKELKAL